MEAHLAAHGALRGRSSRSSRNGETGRARRGRVVEAEDTACCVRWRCRANGVEQSVPPAVAEFVNSSCRCLEVMAEDVTTKRWVFAELFEITSPAIVNASVVGAGELIVNV